MSPYGSVLRNISGESQILEGMCSLASNIKQVMHGSVCLLLCVYCGTGKTTAFGWQTFGSIYLCVWKVVCSVVLA